MGFGRLVVQPVSTLLRTSIRSSNVFLNGSEIFIGYILFDLLDAFLGVLRLRSLTHLGRINESFVLFHFFSHSLAEAEQVFYGADDVHLKSPAYVNDAEDAGVLAIALLEDVSPV